MLVDVNRHLHDQQYPWWSGGDGPVFGVHSSEGVVHLRAICRYGVSVVDEWNLVRLLLEYTHTSRNFQLAVKCWDVDDGDILLIQGAYALPAWVHQSGDEAALCCNRCWILRGKVYLIKPEMKNELLSLCQALTKIRHESRLVQAASKAFQDSIHDKTDSIDSKIHCAAVVLPRSVAHLVSTRPDLVSMACDAFAEQAKLPNEGTSFDWDDWVWTTYSFGRTQYALLRTLCSSPEWKTPEAIPARYKSVQLQRRQRQAAVEATPHLMVGVQLGVRLVAGLDYILSQPPLPPPQQPSLERRILQYWPHLLKGDAAWLLQAWQAGPREAQIDLENLLQCPFYQEELLPGFARTALSHPEQSIQSQIRAVLKQGAAMTSSWQGIPRAQDVDGNEDWMTMPSEEEMRQTTEPRSSATTAKSSNNKENKVLGTMLDDVHAFFKGASSIEGVTHDKDDNFTINPTAFMNILHATLKAETTDDLSFLDQTDAQQNNDPYFSLEDYDLAEDDEEDSHSNENDQDMVDVMQAMDLELVGSVSMSRTLDGPDAPSEIAEGSHVLSNLLQSLEEGGGAPGPVRNLLQEMKREVPVVVDDDVDNSVPGESKL
jgi:hypothetical protein